jgi:ABC-type oligopeptide transport system ATPase subunit
MLREQVYDLMDQVGLERELAKRHPYNVSGGQRQRAAIARALITEPELLIADEPISSLDVSIQSQIVHLLKKLHDERNLTILLIAHDVPMAMHVSDRMISMEKGKCVLPHASTKAIMEGE